MTRRLAACLLAGLLAGLLAAKPAPGSSVLVECEGFQSFGGWVLDQQFMDQMGSPFLLAHGLGEPVRDATTTVPFPATGAYRVWVRTRDWVGPWKMPDTPPALRARGAPGIFQLLIDGVPLPATFGSEGAAWHWQDGGTVTISNRVAALALHDLTGFEGRCDAVLFTTDAKLVPPNEGGRMTMFRRTLLSLPGGPADGGTFDLVVTGGGIAGTCAAVSAARLGLKVALIQDRPVLGGNGSSEVRVWPEGKLHQPPYPRIGDVVAELVPAKDSKAGNAKAAEAYDDDRKLKVARAEPNISLFLEQRVEEVETRRAAIRAVIAHDTHTGKRTRIAGRWFADCTGDAAVGFLAGADFEATAQGHMGASNLWNLRDTGRPSEFPKCLCEDTNAVDAGTVDTGQAARFPRCPWALDLRDRKFPGRTRSEGEKPSSALSRLGSWFWESGFDRDPIAEVEWMRDLNFRAMYGAWDTLKNVDKLYPNHRLAWAAYIAGKRESRRLLGDVVLTVEDVRASRTFPDGCFPCSWYIDLHLPDPAYRKGHEGNEFISRATSAREYSYPGPYWAPYRCLYSRNIRNLFMAGRDISVTHEALGPVRVMQTCGAMGEIVGMAAALCRKHGAMPRDVYRNHLDELKQLMNEGVGRKAMNSAGVNVPTDESSRLLYDPRAKSEMDDLASGEEVSRFTGALPADWALFVEDRAHSIRKSTGLPKRWLSDLPAHSRVFRGSAQPGEFYVFQLGVYAAKKAVGPLSVACKDLPGARCFNLGGTNFMGHAFTAPVTVPGGMLQALWFGVEVPPSARAPLRGSITVTDTATESSQAVTVELAVSGEPLADHGDRDSWRLSRLRWLDSTIGLDDSVVTQPFVPISRKASTLKVLGRELVLGDNGLPRQVRSFFNDGNTAVTSRATRDLLAAPFQFVVETDAGPLKFGPAKLSFVREGKGAVNWRAESSAPGVKLRVDGVLEYDGFADYHCQLTSTQPLAVKDIRLETGIEPGAETYFMGLGRPGGKSPGALEWTWNAAFNQDGFWVGAVNGGFKLQLYGANWRTPLINAYYHFRELPVPESWGGADGKSGGIRLARSPAGMRAAAYSGPRTLMPDRPLDFNFKLFLTPFKPLATDQQWAMRYLHKGQGVNDEDLRDLTRVKAMGANVINIHHNKEQTPTINYPYFDLSMPLLKKCVTDAHASGLKVKIYYTTREISCNLPELYAFWSLNGEIICPSPGRDGKAARPVTNPGGPHPWLVEHLGDTGYIPAWREVIGGRYSNMLDLAVLTTPDSRLDNFYCEGLAFTLRETGFDGMYIDDTGLGRKAFQRAHRIFEAAGKPLLADMHSWSHMQDLAGNTPSAYCYMQNFPYYHRLWFGEGFDYNTPPDYWLVELSGIPFGLMSEMLQGGGNKWRGMLFGMTQRLGWSGDPRPLWKFWDDFGMQGATMHGWWEPACPVTTDSPHALATVYSRPGKALIALASWEPGKTEVKLSVDWKALGLNPGTTRLRAPAIEGYQPAAIFDAAGPIPVEPGQGWLLVAESSS